MMKHGIFENKTRYTSALFSNMLDNSAALWYYINVARLALKLSVRRTVPRRQTYPADMASLRNCAH